MLVTEPNAALPPYRRKAACDSTDAKGRAAGILYVAPDGDILLLRRSGKEANFAGHWALPGGGVEEGESPEEGAARESEEEIATRPTKLKALDQRRTPNGFIFDTFVSPTTEKFVPKLNDEHSGYAWASLDMLPEPIHPAVKATLSERIGAAEDMSPEDWTGLREGFLKWTAEEEAEPEHAADGGRLEDYQKWALLEKARSGLGSDSSLMAFDRASVRTKDKDGRLRIALAHMSKATVNPYRGAEIPGSEEMGLDPEQIYYLLRCPEELKKAASTFNGLPFLEKHVPVCAEDHAREVVIGSTGNEAVFNDPYLDNSLVVWTQDAIDDIEDEVKKELSCGYHYRADMTPGIFNGMRFDGVMRDIVGNHVALVKDGRAGPDVVIGDSMENLMAKSTRIALIAMTSTAAMIQPLMAMDAQPLKLAPLFKDLTTKNFAAKKPAIMTALKSVKLAKDASIQGVVELIEALEGNKTPAADEPLDEEAAKALEAGGEVSPTAAQEEFVSKDSGHEKLRGFLKDCGMDDANIETAMGMMPQAAATDEFPKKDDDEADKKKAEDESDEEDKKGMDKKAMDSAITSAVTAAVTNERKVQNGIRTALADVRPYVGELSMAFDSAEQVYRKAAGMMAIDGADTIHESALPTLIKMQPKPGARPNEQRTVVAMDAASITDFEKRFPGASRIQSI